ncbi:MAG TPA: sigma-70 family RNA polymerase sigma factor, partial [Gemmataceae bacterium]|nr:sigma-70 family RNA polymerase sigma factor [Gemmataceae bacterium]
MDWDELLRQLRAKEPGAWEELLNYLFRSALGLLRLRRVAAARENAEDLAQQVAILVCQHLADFQLGDHLRNWVNRVLRQRIADHCRDPRRGQDPKGGAETSGQEIEVAGKESDPSAQAEQDDALRQLEKCIEQLPQPHLSVVKLRQAGWTFEGIADLLG